MININTLYIIYRVRVRVCVREVTTAACTINTRTQSALCVYNGLYMDRCNLRVRWVNNNNRNIMYIEHRKPWMLMRSTGVYSDILLWRSRFFRPTITADRPPKIRSTFQQVPPREPQAYSTYRYVTCAKRFFLLRRRCENQHGVGIFLQ